MGKYFGVSRYKVQPLLKDIIYLKRIGIGCTNYGTNTGCAVSRNQI